MIRALAALFLAAFAFSAWPQAYPSKPVKIVVPYAVGGPADIYARFLAARMQESLGQPVVVEDRPGAGSIVGTDFAAKSPADGYTLLMMSNTHTVNETLIPKKPFELMRDFVWSMLDNKFLKQPGVGLKLLLASELNDFLNREDREFHQRARIDKQNMIPSLDWTGEALYDLANARIRSCGVNGKAPALRTLLDESITDQRLVDAFRSLRVPRHLFKFLYRLLVAHCNAHTDDKPVWQIPRETFEATLAVYSRDQDAVDRGLAAG